MFADRHTGSGLTDGSDDSQAPTFPPESGKGQMTIYDRFCLQRCDNATLNDDSAVVIIKFTILSPNTRHTKITWLLTNWKDQCQQLSEQQKPNSVRLLWQWESDPRGSLSHRMDDGGVSAQGGPTPSL